MLKAKDLFKKYRKILIIIGRGLSVGLSLLLVVFCNMFKSLNEENINIKVELLKNLQDPLTWILSFSIAIAWSVVYFVVYQTCKEKKLQENQPLFIKYDTLNKSKCNNFRDFIKKVVNVKRKKDAYYTMMERKLEKVQFLQEKIPEDKRNNSKFKILKDRELDIIKKSTNEYIEEHFSALSVKYNRVKLEDFTFAVSSSKVTDKTFSNEKNKVFTKLSTKIIGGVLLSMSGVSILSTLKGVFEWKETGLWITLLVILVSIFCQIYFASGDADTIVDSEIIAPIKTKIEIIEASMLWNEADMTNKPMQKLIDEYVIQENKELQEKKATITKAELDYLQKHKEEIDKKIIDEEMKGDKNNGS